MSSEEAISQIEFVDQPKPKKINIEKKKLKIIRKPRESWNYGRLNLKVYLEKHKACIKIQSYWRGYNLRKELITLNDNYKFEILDRCLDNYIANLKFNNKINALLSKKKIRNENFPSAISENIVKFVIAKKYGITPCWDTNKGDLVIDKKNIPFYQIEVKGFMSHGPTSFGPNENWDWIYFVDAIEVRNKKFKVYEIKLSNTSEIWRCIKINKKETYGEIVDKNQRGKLRGCFNTIFKPQLGEYCKLIFDGYISQLN